MKLNKTAFLMLFLWFFAPVAAASQPAGFPRFVTLNMSGFTDPELNGQPVYLAWGDAPEYAWFTDGSSYIAIQPLGGDEWDIEGLDTGGLLISSQTFSWSGGPLPFLPPSYFQYTSAADGSAVSGDFSISVPEPAALSLLGIFALMTGRRCRLL